MKTIELSWFLKYIFFGKEGGDQNEISQEAN